MFIQSPRKLGGVRLPNHSMAGAFRSSKRDVRVRTLDKGKPVAQPEYKGTRRRHSFTHFDGTERTLIQASESSTREWRGTSPFPCSADAHAIPVSWSSNQHSRLKLCGAKSIAKCGLSLLRALRTELARCAVHPVRMQWLRALGGVRSEAPAQERPPELAYARRKTQRTSG